jgi:hypothetical protein
MANVIVRVFQADDQENIDFAEGKLNGLGFLVTRINNVENLNLVDDTQDPATNIELEDVVVLVASKE